MNENLSTVNPHVLNFLKEFYDLEAYHKLCCSLLLYLERRLEPEGPLESTEANAVLLTELWIAQNPGVDFYV